MPHIFNDKHLEKLLSQKRIDMLRVDEVLDIADIKNGKDILDIGSGPGLFTLPSAKLTTGTVTAVDMSEKMTTFLSNRLSEENITNVKVINGTVESLDDEAFDRVLIVHLIHEVPDPKSFAKQIAIHMAEGGLVTLVDWKKIPTEFGPPVDHRISENELAQIFESDFTEISRIDWGPNFYLMVFKRI